MDYDFDEQESGLGEVEEEQHQRGHLDEESGYVCNSCGEEIVIPLDYSPVSYTHLTLPTKA